MKKNNKKGREASALQNSPPGAAMGEAEATAAKSTKASDAARDPATEEERSSGVCGKKEVQNYDAVQDEIHSCISFVFIGDFPGF